MTPSPTPQAGNEQSSRSWQPRVVNEEPSLPPPKPKGPEPVRSHDLLPPPTTEVTIFTLGLRGGGLAASSASSSGAFPHFGLVPVQVVLRQCPKDIFEDFSTDGSNMNDEFTCAGIWDSLASMSHDVQGL